MNVTETARIARLLDRDAREGYFVPHRAARPPVPPPPAPSFDVVPVAALTSRTDRMRCAPYKATISAGTCADRQGQRATNRGNGTTRAQYECCTGCTLGAELVARLARVGAL